MTVVSPRFERRILKARGMKSTVDDLQRMTLALAFTCHITIGYLLMLCAMTYQVEYLFAVAVGLGLGHYVFNADAPVGDRSDPCCPSDIPTE